MKNLVSLFLLSVLFVGCGSSSMDVSTKESKSPSETVYKESKMMKYKVVAQGEVPRDQELYIDGKEQVVVFHSDSKDDMKKFSELFQKLEGKGSPDFDGNVVVVMRGTKSTTGYGIELESVKIDGRYTDVKLKFNKPNGIAGTALTNPYIVVYIPNDHRDVRVSTVD